MTEIRLIFWLCPVRMRALDETTSGMCFGAGDIAFGGCE